MKAIITDIFKIKNILRLIKNPLLIKKFFSRINYYPGLKFGYSNSNFYKNLEIIIMIFFAKRKKSFQKFFFIKKNITINQNYYNFDSENIINKEQLESLAENGIIVIENILDISEFDNIYKKTNQLVDQAKNNTGMTNVSMTDDLIKISLEYKLEKNSKLNLISNKISQIIYGKKIEPSTSIILTKALKIPESEYPGDNNLHPDRYLPNIKMFYYLKDVDNNCAPFTFSLGSHKIDQTYIDYFKNSDIKNGFDERNPNSRKFTKNTKIFTVKKNSLIIALTNGFHGRSKFEKLNERVAIFFQYSAYDLKSLIFNN